MIKLMAWCVIVSGLFSMPLVCATHSGVIIVVHGTWGLDSPWCKPGGAFFDTLEKTAHAHNRRVLSYTWQGYLNHENRELAALGLVKLIQSYPPSMNIAIVAHSHGGNVAILASQMLGSSPPHKHKIDTLYTLGTPINTTSYAPNMHCIKQLYNLFSFADMVQPVMGIFGRVFPDHPRIANIRLIIDGQEPGHQELYSEHVATWLPLLHEPLAQQKVGQFQHFTFELPGIIYCSSQGDPVYGIDTQRNALLMKDLNETQKIMRALIRQKRHSITQSLHHQNLEPQPLEP